MDIEYGHNTNELSIQNHLDDFTNEHLTKVYNAIRIYNLLVGLR